VSFLKYLLEDYGQASGALATTVSNELQPDYNNPPKQLLNPYEAVLAAHTVRQKDTIGIEQAAKLIKDKYNHIYMDTLAEILKDHNLELKSNHPKALENLFTNLKRIVAKFR